MSKEPGALHCIYQQLISSAARHRPGNPNSAIEIVPITGEIAVPICRSNEEWRVVVGPPAQYSNLANATARPSAPVARRAHVTRMPAILDPFVDVAMHVVKPEGVRRETSDGRRQRVIPIRCRNHRNWHNRSQSNCPTGNIVRDLARAAYSHSASLNRRYVLPVLALALSAATSCWAFHPVACIPTGSPWCGGCSISTRIRRFCSTRFEELGHPLGEELLLRHRCYYPMLRPVLDLVNGLAHITGGGLPGKMPAILPEDLAASFQLGSWQVPAIFPLIQRTGG